MQSNFLRTSNLEWPNLRTSNLNWRCLRTPILKFICLFILWSLSSAGFTQEPTRVARLSDFKGSVSLLPSGEQEWVTADRNRPFINGDSVWNDENTFSTIQVDIGTFCIGTSSSITFVNLSDKMTQIQLAQGSMDIRVWSIAEDQNIEIDTPNLAFTVENPGYYRIDVDNEGNATMVSIREGEANVYGDNASYELTELQTYQFTGTNLENYQVAPLAKADDLDTWCLDHMRRGERKISKRYVSEYTVGYEDLDDYGSWQEADTYGAVWFPTGIDVDWAPYRHGHWLWLGPWQWTWVGDEPWGFAPYHYGRWVQLNDRWGWVPGPRNAYPYYAPALVAFVGGNAFQLSVMLGEIGADIAWFPLGPGEIYWPSYEVSRNYFININVGGTVVNQTVVANAFAHPKMKMHYRNMHVPNAVTAVPKNAFVESKSVNKSRVKIPQDKLATAPVSHDATLQPVQASVMGAGGTTHHKPSEKILNRAAIAKTTPPAPTTALPGAEKETQGPGAAKGKRFNQNLKVISPKQPSALPKGPSPKGEIEPMEKGKELQKKEIKRPEVKRPERKRPEIKKPDLTQPEMKGPGITRPEKIVPEVTTPKEVRPEVKRPNRTIQQEVPKEEVIPEKGRKPFNEPQMRKREEIRKQEISKPEISKPEISKPEMRKPEIQKPEFKEPRTKSFSPPTDRAPKVMPQPATRPQPMTPAKPEMQGPQGPKEGKPKGDGRGKQDDRKDRGQVEPIGSES